MSAATARAIVERLPMFAVAKACSHCPRPLDHDYGYAANQAHAIIAAALDAAVAEERARLRRRLIERGPHHVECPANDDRTADCRCLVNEFLRVLFQPEPPR